VNKTLGVFLVVIFLSLAFSLPTTAANPIPIYIDGKQVAPDVPPVLRNGRVFVPIRFISENLGAVVYWKDPDIFIDRAVDVFSLTLGETEPETSLDVAPFLVNDRTMVPLRYVAEHLFVNIDYKDGKVIITRDYISTWSEAAPTLKTFSRQTSIYQDDFITVFKDKDTYFAGKASINIQSEYIKPTQVCALRLDEGNRWHPVDFCGISDDGTTVFAWFSYPIMRFYSIKNDETKFLTHGIAYFGEYELFKSNLYYISQPNNSLMNATSSYGGFIGNIRKVNIHVSFSNDNRNNELVGNPDFLYCYYLSFFKDSGHVYTSMRNDSGRDVHWELNKKENCIYAVGVNPKYNYIPPIEKPFSTAGYYKIDLETNTHTRIRDLNPDEYQIITEPY